MRINYFGIYWDDVTGLVYLDDDPESVPLAEFSFENARTLGINWAMFVNNPFQFATNACAQKVAEVVRFHFPGARVEVREDSKMTGPGPYMRNCPERFLDITLPGREVRSHNAGLIANGIIRAGTNLAMRGLRAELERGA